MRRGLLIGGSILGVIVLVIVALFGYAVLNLNSIIETNRDRILSKVSDSLGRPVAVSSIKATLGWGVALDVSGLTLADEPAFSNQPMVSVQDAYCRVELIPLLSKRIRIVRLDIQNPVIRVIWSRSGELNVAMIGKKGRKPQAEPQPRAEPRAPAPQGSMVQAGRAGAALSGAGALAELSINSFSIANGTILYQDPEWGPNPVAIRKLDLDVEQFRMP